jgi:hypothetical protein
MLHHTNLSPLLHRLDPAHEEPELEAQVEQTEEANPNPEPEQGKPGAFNHAPCLLF